MCSHILMKHLWNKLWFVSIFTVFAFTFQKWYPWDEKPLVSGCETLEFSLWNPWFHDVKTRLSDCNLMGFRTRSQNCIFMQFWGRENCMRFSENSYPLNGFTTRQPWQLNNNPDNPTTITTLFSCMLMSR